MVNFPICKKDYLLKYVEVKFIPYFTSTFFREPIIFDREQRSRGPKNYFVGDRGSGGGSEFQKTSEFKENRKSILIVAILHLGNAILH